MLFGTEKRLSNLNNQQIDLEYNSSKVSSTSSYKYLGVHLKPSLNVNDHVNKAYKKASGYLKLLAKIRPFLSVTASLDIYRSMVIPVLTYCSLVCTCATNTQKKRLERFEKRAARIIFGTSEQPMTGRMPSVETIQKTKSCILTLRCLKKDVCQNFLNYFTVIDSKVATRNQGCSINLPRVRLETAKKGFYFYGGILYNETRRKNIFDQSENLFTFWR